MRGSWEDFSTVAFGLGRGVIKVGGWKGMWGENSSEAEQGQWP